MSISRKFCVENTEQDRKHPPTTILSEHQNHISVLKIKLSEQHK
jgi:hypothetical protein